MQKNALAAPQNFIGRAGATVTASRNGTRFPATHPVAAAARETPNRCNSFASSVVTGITRGYCMPNNRSLNNKK